VHNFPSEEPTMTVIVSRDFVWERLTAASIAESKSWRLQISIGQRGENSCNMNADNNSQDLYQQKIKTLVPRYDVSLYRGLHEKTVEQQYD